jgi:branched-chain amino acid transport system substrate-binding protein
MKNLTRLAALALVAVAGSLAAAGPIVIGQVACIKGPAERLGRGMNTGLTVAFEKAGPVNGNPIELRTTNDGYEPEKCAAATTSMLDDAKIVAAIGYVGTPTSKVAIPLTTAKKVPFIGAFTGAMLLREPYNEFVVNVRASYDQETESLAAHFVDGNRATKVAVVYQNDAFGQAGLSGMTKALAKRKLEVVATGTFERNTLDIDEAVKTVAAATPDVVFIVGPYKPVAATTRALKSAAANAKVCTLSFVGTESLLADLQNDGDGMVVSQVVPFPWDDSVPVVKSYLEDMKASGNDDEIGFISLEGYIVGKFFVDAASKVTGDFTGEAFVKTVQTAGKFNIGGFNLTFGPNDNQGSDTVWLTEFKGGKVVQLKSAPIASAPEPK